MRHHKSYQEEMVQLYLKRKENQTQKQFAKEQNINLHTFKNWLWLWKKNKKAKEKKAKEKKAKPTNIIELKPSVIVTEKQTTQALQSPCFSQPTWIGLPNGVELQAPVASIQQLIKLIKELQA